MHYDTLFGLKWFKIRALLDWVLLCGTPSLLQGVSIRSVPHGDTSWWRKSILSLQDGQGAAWPDHAGSLGQIQFLIKLVNCTGVGNLSTVLSLKHQVWNSLELWGCCKLSQERFNDILKGFSGISSISKWGATMLRLWNKLLCSRLT